MRIVRTLYSTYEIDTEKELIRRVEGQHSPTARQGVDGEWQSYQTIHVVYDSLLIVYGGRNLDGSLKCTRTSQILSDGETL